MGHQSTKELKEILANIRTPEKLDSHPWTKSLFVQEMAARMPPLAQKGPGVQLVMALGQIFPKMMPCVPPKHALRLDNHWAEFGMLASQYFAPLRFGMPYPVSFRDAWGRIDDAILCFVAEESARPLTEEERLPYRLICDEPEVAPKSTLSDWHRKGIQRLVQVILDYESHLSQNLSQPSVILGSSKAKAKPVSPLDDSQGSHAADLKPAGRRTTRFWKRGILAFISLLALVLIVLGGLKVQRIYRIAERVKQDIQQLQGLTTSVTGIKDIQKAGPLFSTLRRDMSDLNRETAPLLWLTPLFHRMPTYGGDISAAGDLLGLAESLSVLADELFQTSQPVLTKLGEAESLSPSELTGWMVESQPDFAEARQTLDRAVAFRSNIHTENLSPEIRTMIVEQVDPVLSLLDEGLSLAVTLPRLMGATQEGPKTYLLLVQNEDELRPTGGFIGAVGTMVVKDGNVVSLDFEDSYNLDDWSKAYPVAPWQLEQYMNIPVLMFRDSNWFTDYPTAVLYAESLYSVSRSHSADGVIAFDQHMLVLILDAIGPLEVEDVPYSITADNVISYMRSAKIPPPIESRPEDWHRKAFINKLAGALMNRILVEGDVQWDQLARAVFHGLNEKHILLQFDDPAITGFVGRHGWDGSVRPGVGDFLMVVDANVGYTKSNAVLETSLFYDVDLTNPSTPEGFLTVIQKNNASSQVPCVVLSYASETMSAQEMAYAMDRCYWGYLRIYKPAGTVLTKGTPHAVPESQMMLGRGIPARVDLLDEEISDVQAFGTLVLVPGGQSLTTTFQFALPATVLEIGTSADQTIYRLKLQKQPGTLAHPITIRIHLPSGVTVDAGPADALIQGNNVIITANLRTDRNIEIVFTTR